MGKKDPFMNRALHPRLTNEQCCQLVAMRDVRGVKAAEKFFGVPSKTQASLNDKVKSRPDLERTYWQYRNSMAKQWANTLAETTIAVLTRINQEVSETQIDLATLRELTRTFEVLGDISVSVSAVAPEAIQDDTPLFEVIDVEGDNGQLLLSGAKDGVSG